MGGLSKKVGDGEGWEVDVWRRQTVDGQSGRLDGVRCKVAGIAGLEQILVNGGSFFFWRLEFWLADCSHTRLSLTGLPLFSGGDEIGPTVAGPFHFNVGFVRQETAAGQQGSCCEKGWSYQ